MNASGTSSVVKWAAWLAFAAVVGVVAARFVPQLTEPEVIRGRLVEGTELQVIFLVSPSCAVCTSSEFTQQSGILLAGQAREL